MSTRAAKTSEPVTLRRAAPLSRIAIAICFGMFGATLIAQPASLIGKVLLDGKETPLANAEVHLPQLNLSSRSDAAGSFLLGGIPAGTHRVMVRLVGYEPFVADITFKAAEKFDADILLKPSVTKLKDVDVKATATTGPWAIKLQEFDERRAIGVGRYLTADYFESQDGRPPSSYLMQKIPGPKVVQSGGRKWLASTRGGIGKGSPPEKGGSMERMPPACYMQVVVNGLIRYNGSEGQQMFDVDELNSKDIIGFEFYTTATTPLQYNATRGPTSGSCGTVINWTKGG